MLYQHYSRKHRTQLCFTNIIRGNTGHSYDLPTLFEETPDTVILQVGTNNITKKRQTEKETVKEITDIVQTCNQCGVNNISVSGLTCRPEFESEINEINRLLHRGWDLQICK